MARRELVGRDTELSVLAQSLDAALEGQARLVLCQGEPGIGKTRLAEELLTLAGTKGVRGVWGVAVESAGAPPYWPWRQVLHAVAGIVDLTAIADEHRLTVDLARLAPDLFASGTGPDDAAGSTEDRFRQFDAVAVLMREVTRRDPLVVVLDDAHWADSPSLLLLHHVARGLRNERLLVVVNHRHTEQAHGALLSELVREPVTRQVHLRGLRPAAVGRQLASLVGRDVGEAQAAHIHAHTGGNPFFVAEVGRILLEQPADPAVVPVTTNLREAIGARLLRLSPQGVRLLQAASIVGCDFPVGVVAAMVDLPVMSCVGALDEAVAAGQIEIKSTPGEHRFAHPLVRDAIEAGLGTPERVRLHRLAAEAVEQAYGDRLGSHLFDLARHWAVAAVQEDRGRALGWIELAGGEAMRAQAYEEGARLFRLALDVGARELDDVGRCGLLLALGSALHLSSDIPGGIEATREAADLAGLVGRPDLVAEAALVMEPTLDLEINLTIRQLCERAIAGLGTEKPALQARVAARLAEVCHYLGDAEPARPASVEGLALAERSGDPVAVAAALHARQLVCSGPDGLDERADLAERMLPGPPERRRRGADVGVSVAGGRRLRTGRPRECDARGERRRRLCPRGRGAAGAVAGTAGAGGAGPGPGPFRRGSPARDRGVHDTRPDRKSHRTHEPGWSAQLDRSPHRPGSRDCCGQRTSR